jgi:hypothetical protein
MEQQVVGLISQYGSTHVEFRSNRVTMFQIPGECHVSR